MKYIRWVIHDKELHKYLAVHVLFIEQNTSSVYLNMQVTEYFNY